jgi:DNA replication and repair protein RecF
VTGELQLDRLWLTDFRNYDSVDLELSPGLTVITGANGNGKTNLLEAVGYLATQRSFRGAPAEAMVRSGSSSAVLRSEGRRDGRAFLVEAELPAQGRARMQVNRQRVRRARDLAEALVVSVFTPDDLELVKGGPGGRRRYLDDTLVALHPPHDQLQRELDRVLRQKGALLKQARGRATADVRTTLEVWNDKLVDVGERLAEARATLLGELEPWVQTATADIAAPAAVAVTLRYRADWRAEGLEAALGRVADDEVRRGVCLVGPQRDDVAVELNGLPSRTHASQGEQRTLTLALRLGAHRLLTATLGAPPVLLLDDIFSELDPARSEALLAQLPAGQALLTTAGPPPPAARPDRLVQVDGGVLEAVSG